MTNEEHAKLLEMGRLDPYKHIVVKHHFIGGIYTKECHIPVGFIFAKHVHKFGHQSVLVSGTAIVEIDGVQKELTGPVIINVEAKKTHSVTPVTPVVWLCQHVTSCTDPDEIDAVTMNLERS